MLTAVTRNWLSLPLKERSKDFDADLKPPKKGGKDAQNQDNHNHLNHSRTIQDGIGVEEFSVQDPRDIEAPIQVHAWDFAGNQVHQAAHSLFLSEGCIYVIVVNANATIAASRYALANSLSFLISFNFAPQINSALLTSLHLNSPQLTSTHFNSTHLTMFYTSLPTSPPVRIEPLIALLQFHAPKSHVLLVATHLDTLKEKRSVRTIFVLEVI